MLDTRGRVTAWLLMAKYHVKSGNGNGLVCVSWLGRMVRFSTLPLSNVNYN